MIGFILTGVIATLASVLYRHIQRWRRGQSKVAHKELAKIWEPILEEFVLSLSDQQLVTGLLLVTLTIPKYWNFDLWSLAIAGDLAFFSIITHFTTILALQQTLRGRSLKKLALIRMCLVFITLFLWILITIRCTSYLWVISHSTRLDALTWFSLIASIIDMVGSIYVFWNICLFLLVTEDAINARKAIGKGLRPAPDDQEFIKKCLPRQHHCQLPQDIPGLLLFMLRESLSWLREPRSWLKEPLSWLFGKFCQSYLVPKTPLLQALLWALAEVIFPIRSSSILLFILLIIGIINVILDMIQSGLRKSWGFGQLLPAFMLLLPFFSLAQKYARKSFCII